jgi:hypothetical protein
MMNRDLQIDEEFKNLLGSHSSEEFEQLKQNLIADGRVIDPIIAWEGHDIVVDGHTRYQIAIAEGIPFQVIDLPFSDREAVKQWIYGHQFGRRNGNGFELARWRSMLVDMIARKNSAPTSRHKAVKEVSQKTGVNKRVIYSDQAATRVLDSIPEQARRNIETGVIRGSVESVAKIASLPETQRSQVVEILENLPTSVEEEVTFRSVDEVIQAVAEHQTNQAPPPKKASKEVEQAVARIEKAIAELPKSIDVVASGKKLHRSPWKERTQAAFANFVSLWREQCKKPTHSK